MNEFIYDDSAPYNVNFNRWCYANRVEREMYNEPKLDEDSAKNVFKKMWGFKQLNERVFVN
tara:strand:- start:674 stop:856 length:183 start_codon:yes stop_codon:yes gene_type:complete